MSKLKKTLPSEIKENIDIKEPEKYTYTQVELAIVEHFDKEKNLIIPNCFMDYKAKISHECDILLINTTGYATEVEIKMSVSDFKADFKKKHKHDDERLKYLYYAVPHYIKDKCLELVPEYGGLMSISKNKRGKFIIEIIKNAPKKTCRKFTLEEKYRFARLCSLKYWNAKIKYTKKETKK